MCILFTAPYELSNLLYGVKIWDAWPFGRFQARSCWCTEEVAASHPRQIMLKLLMLQPSSL